MKPTNGQPPLERACYCNSFSAEWKAQQGIPEGFCGICERCGKPGHTQHFPGPVPYTGAWCDRCVEIVSWTRVFRNPVFLLILVLLAVCAIFLILQWF